MKNAVVNIVYTNYDIGMHTYELPTILCPFTAEQLAAIAKVRYDKAKVSQYEILECYKWINK